MPPTAGDIYNQVASLTGGSQIRPMTSAAQPSVNPTVNLYNQIASLTGGKNISAMPPGSGGATNQSTLPPYLAGGGYSDSSSGGGLNVGNIPQTFIPPLNYTPPSATDLQNKWNEFLQRAANDPDIVNYYKKLLDQAQGDTNIALGFLNQEYEMGTRFQNQNLAATLQSLTGLTFPQEQQSLLDTLNKRGIALTQGSQGDLQYGGGGQSGYELGQLNLSQQLRTEAERRSASQNIEQLGLKNKEQTTQAGQQLSQYALTSQKQKEQDIAQRAGQYYGFFQGGEQAKLLQAQQAQQKAMISGGTSGGGGGGGGGDSELTQLIKIGQSTGGRNPVQESRYKQLLSQQGVA